MGELKKNADGTHTFIGGFSSRNPNDAKQIISEVMGIKSTDTVGEVNIPVPEIKTESVVIVEPAREPEELPLEELPAEEAPKTPFETIIEDITPAKKERKKKVKTDDG